MADKKGGHIRSVSVLVYNYACYELATYLGKSQMHRLAALSETHSDNQSWTPDGEDTSISSESIRLRG